MKYNKNPHMQANRPFILMVDDIPSNIEVLGNILAAEGYAFTPAISGRQALKVIERRVPDLILLDVMMPEMDGFEVCRNLKKSPDTRDIPIIFLTAKTEPEDIVNGFEAGCSDYVAKPFNATELIARVRTHLELAASRRALADQNDILEQKVREKTKELLESRLEVIHRLIFTAEYKDPETGSHIKRMSHYSALLAREYGLEDKECETLLISSAMHDIGKIGIPDRILLKAGKLDQREWDVMKTHTEIGTRILENSNSPLIQTGLIVASAHHEKWDGSGYPKGLKGVEIPVQGRITALADVFDALTSVRPYKPAWPVEKAVAEIKAGSDRHFEPLLVQKFLDILPRILDVKDRFQ